MFFADLILPDLVDAEEDFLIRISDRDRERKREMKNERLEERGELWRGEKKKKERKKKHSANISEKQSNFFPLSALWPQETLILPSHDI